MVMTGKQRGSTRGDLPGRRWRPWGCWRTAIIISSIGLAWEFRRPWFQGNLGVVDPGQVIRSAQPTTDLPRLIREYRLGLDPQPAGRKPDGLVVRS